MAEIEVSLPWWKTILDCSEKWGIPPWEIMGEEVEGRFLWVLRQQIWESEIEKATREKEKHK